MPLELILMGAAAAVLAAAALHDIAARTIPDRAVLAVAVLGAAGRSLSGDLAPALLAALLVFAAGVVAWRAGALGGGDVKLLAAAALLVPPGVVPGLLLAVALCGGVLALATLGLRRVVPRPAAARPARLPARVLRAEAWRLRRGGPLPYAVAIALGTIWSMPA